MIQLRPDQKEVAKQILTAFKQGHKNILICAVCGWGKSYVMAWFEEKKTDPSLITCHRKELKEQHQKLMPESRIELPITAYNLLQKGQLGAEKILHIDEAHLALSETWQTLINHYKGAGAYTMAWSATPTRLDGKPMGNLATALIKAPGLKWCIENKLVSPFKYYCPQIKTLDTLSDIMQENPELYLKEYDEAFKKPGVYGDVVNTYKKFLNNKKTIVYCINKSHAKEVAEAFQEAGLSAFAIDSDNTKDERKDLMQKFHKGEIKILCNCGLLSEGISVNDLYGVMLLRPTSSYALFIQQSTRPLRLFKDDVNKTAIIIDMVANFRRHGLPDDEVEFTLNQEKKSRTKQFNEEGNFNIRYCQTCYQAFKTANKCPYCQTTYSLEPREIEAQHNIEISEIKESQKAMKKKNMATFNKALKQCWSCEDAMQLAIKHGYSPFYGKIRWDNGRGKWIHG